MTVSPPCPLSGLAREGESGARCQVPLSDSVGEGDLGGGTHPEINSLSVASTRQISRREWGALALILALAAILRMGAPGLTEFKRDEGNLSQLALDLVHGRDWPLLGLSSSVNVPNPPISIYLMAIPFVFSDSPIPATMFVGLLNVIAVGLAWELARRYYGPLAAITAGVLYAASPWAVLYSRKIWAQDLLPPFVVAVIFTGLLGYGEGKRWARWLHWPLLAIAVQIHYAAFTLIPISLLLLILWPHHGRRRDLLIGLALAALTAIPALIGAAQDGWLSPATMRERWESSPAHERAISTAALDYAWFIVAGTNLHSLAGPEQFRHYLASVPDVDPLLKLVPLGAIPAATGLVWRALRRGSMRQSPAIVLVAWLILPVLAFTWEWTKIAPHYVIPMLPAAYILCGAGIQKLFTTEDTEGYKGKTREMARVSFLVLVVMIAGFQVYLLVQLLRFVDTHATPGGFGTPLHYLMDVREAVLDQHPDSVIVVSEEELAPFGEIPAVWSVLLEPVADVRFVNGTRTAVIPAGAALELIAWSPALRTCPDQSCADQVGARDFEQRPGENPYILRPAEIPAWADGLTAIEPLRFANGAILTGYAVRNNGVVLSWQLSGPPEPASDYQAFVHALNANGEKLAQADRPSWPARYWRAGDELVLWFDLALSPGTTALAAGMYRFEGGATISAEVIDEQSAYVAQSATISLD